MILKIFIGEGNDKLDLFKEENITNKSSVADTQDITKNTTDFTKGFQVPASDENNRIFNHYYDATIDNSFDARTKVIGRIELGGVPFRTGKFSLTKVQVKSGRPFSYTINFTGNLVDIKSKVKNFELKDLDLTDFDHDFNGANIKTGLTSSLFSGDIIYNLLVKKQYFYNSDPENDTQSESLSNIALGGKGNTGSGNNFVLGTGIVFSDLRASIRLIKIIEQIETQFNLKFSRDFFGRTEFTNLFMWLNNDAEIKKPGISQIVEWKTGDQENVNFETNIGTFLIRNSDLPDDEIDWFLHITITPDPGFEDIDYTLRTFRDDEVLKEENLKGTQRRTTKLIERTPENGTIAEIFYEIETNQEFRYSAKWEQDVRADAPVPDEDFETLGLDNIVESVFSIQKNIPELKIIDFLKSLFSMFKLVIIPLEEEGSYFVNNLQSYYDSGKLIDITKHIDFSVTDVSRGEILSEINYLFEEPTTIGNIQFEKGARPRHFYGDDETLLTDEEGEPLDGDDLEIKLSFEQFLYDRLLDGNTGDSQTQVQYGAIVDEDREPVNPKPHIFYNVLTDLSGKRVAFIDEDDIRTDLGPRINTASHTDTLEDPQFALLFGVEFSTWDQVIMKKNLFSNYNSEYVFSLFNIKRRNFKFKAPNMPLDIITKIELNDILRIKQDYYRIDNFKTNLITGEVNFNLFNAFDAKIGAFTPSQTDIFVDFQAQQVSVYVTFLTTFTFVKVDNGSGVDFVTVSSVGSNIFFDFTLNEGPKRNMFIDFTDDVTGQTFRIFLSQEAKVYIPGFDFSDLRNSQYVPFLTTLKF